MAQFKITFPTVGAQAIVVEAQSIDEAVSKARSGIEMGQATIMLPGQILFNSPDVQVEQLPDPQGGKLFDQLGG